MERKTLLFIDSEFTDLTQKARLISLGIWAEDGQSFYAEFSDYSQTIVSEFVTTEILPLLELKDQNPGFMEKSPSGNWQLKGDTHFVVSHLKEFLSQFEKIECWLDYTAYDWVLFCELFGGSKHLPKNIYYIPFDLMTLLKMKGLDPNQDRLKLAEERDPSLRHHALGDAKLLHRIWKKLTQDNMP